MGCRAGGLAEGCQARAWLPRSWRNASPMLGGPQWRGVVTGDSPGTPGVGGARRGGGRFSASADGALGSGQLAGLAMATGAAWLLGGPWPRRRVPRAVWAAALWERGAGRPGVRGKDAWALLTLEYVSG